MKISEILGEDRWNELLEVMPLEQPFDSRRREREQAERGRAAAVRKRYEKSDAEKEAEEWQQIKDQTNQAMGLSTAKEPPIE